MLLFSFFMPLVFSLSFTCCGLCYCGKLRPIVLLFLNLILLLYLCSYYTLLLPWVFSSSVSLADLPSVSGLSMGFLSHATALWEHCTLAWSKSLPGWVWGLLGDFGDPKGSFFLSSGLSAKLCLLRENYFMCRGWVCVPVYMIICVCFACLCVWLCFLTLSLCAYLWGQEDCHPL